jgi:hypothetical protein
VYTCREGGHDEEREREEEEKKGKERKCSCILDGQSFTEK